MERHEAHDITLGRIWDTVPQRRNHPLRVRDIGDTKKEPGGDQPFEFLSRRITRLPILRADNHSPRHGQGEFGTCLPFLPLASLLSGGARTTAAKRTRKAKV
jgi:hypothetical protein